MRKKLSDVQAVIATNSNSHSIQTDFSRYRQTDFLERIESDQQPRYSEQPSDLDQRLYDEFNATFNTEKYKEMFTFRQSLPSYQRKDEIVELVKRHQVLLIAGNTGCGMHQEFTYFLA